MLKWHKSSWIKEKKGCLGTWEVSKCPMDKITKKNSQKECVFVTKYSAMLSKIHSYRLLWQFFPLGVVLEIYCV